MTSQSEFRKWLSQAASKLPDRQGQAIESLQIEGMSGCPPIYIARGKPGQLMVLTQCDPELIAERDFVRVKIHVEHFLPSPNSDAIRMLIAECKVEDYESEFLNLLAAVFASIVATASSNRFSNELFQTFVKWAELFERPKPSEMTMPQAAGIWAELLTVNSVLEKMNESSLAFWQGPKGAPHDFVINGHALEVKAVTTTMISKVTIHGFRQLSPVPSSDLHLAVYQVSDESGDMSIEDLVEQIVLSGIDRLEIMLNLSELGMTTESKWWTNKFSLIAEELFCVDEFFPKIVPENMNAEFDLGAIENVSYSVQIGALSRIAVVKPVHKWIHIYES